MNNIKPFGWRRTLNYFKVNVFIMFKTLTEYKISMFSALFEQMIFYIVQVIFFISIASNFKDIIRWELKDFILLGLLIDFIYVLGGIFYWKRGLRYQITTGDLNKYLVRPINRFFCFNLSELSAPALATTIINLIIIPAYIIFFDIAITNLFYSMLILTIIFLIRMSLRAFTSSINFFSFGLADFLYQAYMESYRIGRNYPFQFFKNEQIFNIFLVIPAYLISSLLIPSISNYQIINLKLQIIIMLSVFIITTIIISLNWHYGLKKYEAFG